MISLLLRILFIPSIYLLLEHLVYFINIWWLIIGIPIVEISLVKWKRWQRIAPITQEQRISGFLALLRIRCAEIGAIYHSIRLYQKEASDCSWIPLFMTEYRYLSNQGLYDDPCDKKKQKYLTKAHALYTRRFHYNPFFGTLEEPELLDTTMAIHFWSSGFDLTIRLLDSIPCDSNLSRHICALIREYRLIQILTLNGNYHILFKNIWILSALIRERYSRLRGYWEEIVRSHQAAIIIAKASNITQQDRMMLDDNFAENEALAQMERNLRRAISQENSKSYRWASDREDEASFFQSLKANPIWIKLYGYDPNDFSCR